MELSRGSDAVIEFRDARSAAFVKCGGRLLEACFRVFPLIASGRTIMGVMVVAFGMSRGC